MLSLPVTDPQARQVADPNSRVYLPSAVVADVRAVGGGVVVTLSVPAASVTRIVALAAAGRIALVQHSG